MKAESAIIIAIVICVFLSIYFSLLSFTAVEDLIKQHFVLLAVYSLLSGIIIFSCLIVYLTMKKILAKTALKDAQTPPTLEKQGINKGLEG